MSNKEDDTTRTTQEQEYEETPTRSSLYQNEAPLLSSPFTYGSTDYNDSGVIHDKTEDGIGYPLEEGDDVDADDIEGTGDNPRHRRHFSVESGVEYLAEINTGEDNIDNNNNSNNNDSNDDLTRQYIRQLSSNFKTELVLARDNCISGSFDEDDNFDEQLTDDDYDNDAKNDSRQHNNGDFEQHQPPVSHHEEQKEQQDLIDHHLSIDDERLQRAISDAGQYAYGIAAVEVWVLDDSTGCLKRPSTDSTTSWWTNPEITNELSEKQIYALQRLTNSNHPRYVKPSPIPAGVDLAGKLFAETTYYYNRPTAQQQQEEQQLLEDHQQQQVGASPGTTGSVNIRESYRVYSTSRNNSIGSLSSLGTKSSLDDFDITPLIGSTSRKSSSSSLNKKNTVELKKAFKMSTFSSSTSSKKVNITNTKESSATIRQPPAPPKPVAPSSSLSSNNQMVQFRDIRSLLIDYDTPKTLRLKLLEKAGFRLAAGVPFKSGWHTGIVIYYALPDENIQYLTSIANKVYLSNATEMIGTVVASADGRRACMTLKLRSLKDATNATSKKGGTPRSPSLTNKFKRTLSELSLLGLSSSPNVTPTMYTPKQKKIIQQRKKQQQSSKRDRRQRKRNILSSEWYKRINKGTKIWYNKCLYGSNLVEIPPAMSWEESGWTLIGVSIALFMISSINQYVIKVSNDELHLSLGPVGALMALQYSVTSSPTSQPRNIVLGQAVAGGISLLLTHGIKETILPVWIRQAIGPAIVVSMLSKLGIIHPPAGGTSVIICSGRYDSIAYYILIVCISIFSIIPAIIINNLSSKRQYPTYWTYNNYIIRDVIQNTMSRLSTTSRKITATTTKQ